MKTACNTPVNRVNDSRMKLWLAGLFAMASVSLACAQSDFDGTLSGGAILRPPGNPDSAILPASSPSSGLTDDFFVSSPAISSDLLTTSITTIPEPASVQLIGLALGVLATHKVTFRKKA